MSMTYKNYHGVAPNRGWGPNPLSRAKSILDSAFEKNGFTEKQAVQVLQKNGFRVKGDTSANWIFHELLSCNAIVATCGEAIGIP